MAKPDKTEVIDLGDDSWFVNGGGFMVTTADIKLSVIDHLYDVLSHDQESLMSAINIVLNSTVTHRAHWVWLEDGALRLLPHVIEGCDSFGGCYVSQNAVPLAKINIS